MQISNLFFKIKYFIKKKLLKLIFPKKCGQHFAQILRGVGGRGAVGPQLGQSQNMGLLLERTQTS